MAILVGSCIFEPVTRTPPPVSRSLSSCTQGLIWPTVATTWAATKKVSPPGGGPPATPNGAGDAPTRERRLLGRGRGGIGLLLVAANVATI